MARPLRLQFGSALRQGGDTYGLPRSLPTSAWQHHLHRDRDGPRPTAPQLVTWYSARISTAAMENSRTRRAQAFRLPRYRV